MLARSSKAEWTGSIRDGSGHMVVGKGAYDGAYSFVSRFEDGAGTNPEELIAAAHAGCFSMALSAELGRAGHEPENIQTTAKVSIERGDAGWEFKLIELQTVAKVPGIDEATLKEIGEKAKTGCPVSKALKAVEIRLDIKLA